MARSFTQLFFHAVVSVKYRQALIDPSWEQELYAIMGDTLREMGHYPIKINGIDDHLHLLWRHHRTHDVANTMKLVKGRSSHWINDAKILDRLFRWQPGYGAFSVSVDRVPSVKGYIEKQKVHHQKITVLEEYAGLLKSHGQTDLREFMFDELL
ncbi:MAG: transposase [Lewinella sp.]